MTAQPDPEEIEPEPEYPCSTCALTFKTSKLYKVRVYYQFLNEILLYYYKKHSLQCGSVDHPCNICDKIFTTEYLLSKHQKKCKPITEKTVFKKLLTLITLFLYYSFRTNLILVTPVDEASTLAADLRCISSKPIVFKQLSTSSILIIIYNFISSIVYMYFI